MKESDISYLGRLMLSILDNAALKLIGAGILITLRFFFDNANKSAMIAVFVLIIMDGVTGLLAAYRTEVPIRSHKLRRTAIKIAVYFMLISAGYQSEHAIPVGFIDETIIATLAFTELLSILENTAKSGFTIAAVIMKKLQKEIPS